MYKVVVNVPAAVTNIGPGLHTLGLALSLHVSMEVSVRQDGDLNIQVRGEGANEISKGFDNPVLRAASRLFQAQEMAPAGLNISIDNRIPLHAGMDAEAAMLIGGLVAANNLTGGAYDRDKLVAMAVSMGLNQVDALTTLLGGLNIGVVAEDGSLLHTSYEPPPLRLVVMVPEVPDYFEKTAGILPELVSLESAVFNMGRLIFLMDAMLDADYDLLAKAMQDRLFQHVYAAHIPGYDAAVQAARDNGAAAITLVGQGPTMLAFAPYNHTLIANSMVEAFSNAGIHHCRFWTLGIDSQGVTVSVAS